jgi:hypothetical protein
MDIADEREREEKEEEKKPVGLQRGTCRFRTNEEEDRMAWCCASSRYP